MEQFNAQVISLIRTIVPVVVGRVLSWLATKQIVDETGEISAALDTIFTISFTTAYYAIARALETFVSAKFGWLLGVAKAPAYKKDAE